MESHAWNHRAHTSLPSARIRREIDRTNDVISKAIGQSATLLRRPCGAHHSISAKRAGTPAVLLDVNTLGWKHRKTAAVPRFLSGVRAKEHAFVTVTELLGFAGLGVDETYARAAAGEARPVEVRGNWDTEVRYP